MTLPLPFDTQGFDVVNVLNIANWALQADPNNTPPVALLAGVTYTGIATQWGSCNRLDLVGSIDQAGTLFIDQSRDGGATWPAALTEQWAGAIGESFAFPTARAVGANAYRLRFTAGGVNLAALVLSPALTVGPIDHDERITLEVVGTIAPLGTTTFSPPVGARFLSLAAINDIGGLPSTDNSCTQYIGAAFHDAWCMYRYGGDAGAVRRRLIRGVTTWTWGNGNAARTTKYRISYYS